jgi:Trp operon repressor
MAQQTSICEKRIQNYKRLISMCCNIAYENVDSMLAPILASFDEAGAVVSENPTLV